MGTFQHHPDGFIYVEGERYPLAFWELAEPAYALPAGTIGRVYEEGVKHHLIMDGNIDTVPSDITDAVLDGYIAKKASYDTALAAWERGAAITNVGGVVTIKEIVLTASAAVIDAVVDPLNVLAGETATITANVGDASVTDSIDWEVRSPGGSTATEADTLVGGIDSLDVDSDTAGTLRITATVAGFGSKTITVEVQ